MSQEAKCPAAIFQTSISVEKLSVSRQVNSILPAGAWPIGSEELSVDKNPFLGMSQDQIQKLDAVLSSEQAKQILSESSSQFGLQEPKLDEVLGNEDNLDRTIEDSLNYIMTVSQLAELPKTEDFLHVFDNSNEVIATSVPAMLPKDIMEDDLIPILDNTYLESLVLLDHCYSLLPLASEDVPKAAANEEVEAIEEVVTEEHPYVEEIVGQQEGEEKADTVPIEDDDDDDGVNDSQIGVGSAEKGGHTHSPVRRSQRQIEKNEREQLEKIKAENAELQRREKEEMERQKHMEQLGSVEPKENLNDLLPLPAVLEAKETVEEKKESVQEEQDKELDLTPVESFEEPPKPRGRGRPRGRGKTINIDGRGPGRGRGRPRRDGESSPSAGRGRGGKKMKDDNSAKKKRVLYRLGQELGDDGGLSDTDECDDDDNFASSDGEKSPQKKKKPVHRQKIKGKLENVYISDSDDEIDDTDSNSVQKSKDANKLRKTSSIGSDTEAAVAKLHSFMKKGRQSEGSGYSDDADEDKTSKKGKRSDRMSDNVTDGSSDSRSPVKSSDRPRVPRKLGKGALEGMHRRKLMSRYGVKETKRKLTVDRKRTLSTGSIEKVPSPKFLKKIPRRESLPALKTQKSLDPTESDSSSKDPTKQQQQPESPTKEKKLKEEPIRKSYPKRENRKPPAHLVEIFEPALFSAPDILKKVEEPKTKSEPKMPDGKEGETVDDVLASVAKVSVGGESLVETKEPAEVPPPNKDKPKPIRRLRAPKSKRTSKGKRTDLDAAAAPDSDGSDAIFTDDPGDSDWCSEDDPDRLWCICKQPHNDRFMILCDTCKDWFHGTCVGVTRKIGHEMEKSGREWSCPRCIKGPEKVKPVEHKIEETPVVVKEEKSVPAKEVYEHKAKNIFSDIPIAMKRKPFKPNQLPSVTSREKVATPQLCIVGCCKPARSDSIYCSNECIQKHANESLQFLTKMGKTKPADSKKDDTTRVSVLERCTGKILTGANAPTEGNLQAWLNEHPTYEVLRPGTTFPSNKYYTGGNAQGKEKEVQKKETPKKITQPKQEKDAGPEPIRLNVRKTLRDILTSRSKDTDDVVFSPDEVKKIVLNVEEELFKLFGDTGSKYKAKYRSLMFNIKDPKNHGLFRKILKGKISPYKLVRMTPEELASKELAMWRERETKHALEIITREQKEAVSVPIIKKTHKGEIEIQDEVTVVFTEPIIEEKSKPKIEPTFDPLNNMLVDTTEKHRSHLFDLNCKICTGKMPPPVEEPPQKKVKGSTSLNNDSKSATKKDRKDKGLKNKKEQLSSSSGKEKSRDKDKTKEKPKTKARDKSKDKGKEKEKVSQSSKEKTSESKESSVKKSSKEVSDREPTSTVSISSPDSAMPTQSDVDLQNAKTTTSVWKGFIVMQDVAKLVVGAFKVSGPTDFLSQDVPDTIQICGRINPSIVWDYVSKVRHSGAKEFVVIRFQPANDEEKSAYVSLYHYLSSRKRFGVVGNAAKMVKDFYIIPLASHNPVPSILKPFDGPGLEEPRPHMLLGVIIRHKGTHRKSKYVAESVDKQKSISSSDKLDSEGSFTPPLDKLPKSGKSVTFGPSVSFGGKEEQRSYTPPLEDLPSRKRTLPQPSNGDSDGSYTPPLEKMPKPNESVGDLGGDSPYDPGKEDEGDVDNDDDKPYDPEDDETLGVHTPETPTSAAYLPPLLSGAVSSQSVSELIDQISKSSNPAVVTTTVLASIATATDLEQQRRLLIELTQKVEEQKRQLEMQKQRIAATVGMSLPQGSKLSPGVAAGQGLSDTLPGLGEIGATVSSAGFIGIGSGSTIIGAPVVQQTSSNDDEAYSPSYTPPLMQVEKKDMDMSLPPDQLSTSGILLPPNLQEILETIKKKGAVDSSNSPNSNSGSNGSVAKLDTAKTALNMLEDPIVKNFANVEADDEEEGEIEEGESLTPLLEDPLDLASSSKTGLKQQDPRIKSQQSKDPRRKSSTGALSSMSASELLEKARQQLEDMAPVESLDTNTPVMTMSSIPTIISHSYPTVPPPTTFPTSSKPPLYAEPLPPGVEELDIDSPASIPLPGMPEPNINMPPPPINHPPVSSPFSGPPPGMGPPPYPPPPFGPPPRFGPPNRFPPPGFSRGGYSNFRPHGPFGDQGDGGPRKNNFVPRGRGRGWFPRGRWQHGGNRDFRGGSSSSGSEVRDHDERTPRDRDERDRYRDRDDRPLRDRDDRREHHGSRNRDRDYRDRDRDKSRDRDRDKDRSRDRDRSKDRDRSRDRDRDRKDRDKDRDRDRDRDRDHKERSSRHSRD